MATTKKANAKTARKKAKTTKKKTATAKAKKSKAKAEEVEELAPVEMMDEEDNEFENPELLQDVTSTELEVVEHEVGDSEDESRFFPEDLQEIEIRKKIVDLRNNIDVTRFELGRVLYYTKVNGLHNEWGYSNWANYLDSGEAGAPRTARYLTEIHTWFEEVVKDKNTIEKIKTVGWSKVKEIISIIQDYKEPIDKWVETAKELSVKKLANAVKARKHEIDLDGKPSDEASEGGESGEEKTPEDKTTTLKYTVYAEHYKTITEALALMDKELPGSNDGVKLSYICQEFINTVLIAKDRDELTRTVLPSLEDRFNGKIIFIDNSTEEVIYNQELLEE